MKIRFDRDVLSTKTINKGNILVTIVYELPDAVKVLILCPPNALVAGPISRPPIIEVLKVAELRLSGCRRNKGRNNEGCSHTDKYTNFPTWGTIAARTSILLTKE